MASILSLLEFGREMDSEKEPGICEKCKKHTVVKLRVMNSFALTVTRIAIFIYLKSSETC